MQNSYQPCNQNTGTSSKKIDTKIVEIFKKLIIIDNKNKAFAQKKIKTIKIFQNTSIFHNI